MGLGLPKGFLMADESDNVRGRALQEQDIQFQRKLPYVQKAYLNGVKKMLLLISYYLGANLDTLRIDVKIKLPHRLSADLLEQYKSAIEYVAEVKNLMLEINPYHKLTLEDLNLMVFKAGLDPEIINIPGLISQVTNNEEGSPEEETFEFGESLSITDMPLSLRQKLWGKLAESIQPVMHLLYEDWNSDNGGLVIPPNMLLESHKKNMISTYYEVAECEMHSRIYECLIKERWTGSTRKLDEPTRFFEKLHTLQESFFLIEPEKEVK